MSNKFLIEHIQLLSLSVLGTTVSQTQTAV